MNKKKFFILLALISHFWIMVDCSITKPVIKSIFLTHFSSDALPYVWLFTIPVNLFVVICYNRFIVRFGCFRLFLFFSLITATLHLFSSYFVAKGTFLSFFLYMWKDIYIMLMFHQLWSVIHTSTRIGRAKYLYGIFFFIGTCGGFLGGAISGYFAVKWGSERLLMLTMPIYLLIGVTYYFVLKTSDLGDPKRPIETGSKGTLADIRLIAVSRPLQLILLAVVFMQVSATIFDYEFSRFLEINIPDQDLRTQFQGKLSLIIQSMSLLFQSVATFLLVRFLGVKRSQFFLPIVLLFNAMICLIVPSFLVITAAFGVVKAFDYSVFQILKEMLYVPLSKEEKFKARALIDVFAYRSSKALASLAVMLIPLLLPTSAAILWILFALYLAWLVGVYLSTKDLNWKRLVEASGSQDVI